MCGIYRIINKSNGKMYIGQSLNVETRLKQHLKSLKNGTHVNKHLQAAFDKYGEEGFCFEPFIECKPGELDYYEIEMISAFETQNPAHGYNIRSGGDSGGAFSEEAKKNMSAASFEKWKSKEYKDRMVEVHRGKPFQGGGIKKGTHCGSENANSHAVEIVELSKIFASISECAEFLSVSVTAVSKAIKKNKKCKNFTICCINV